MIRDRRGFSLTEAIIASVILSFVGVAALGVLRSGMGFTVQSGRQNEAMGHAWKWSEALRNEVSPIDPLTEMHPLDDPAWDKEGVESMTNIDGMAERTVTADPFGAPPGTALSGMKKYQVDVYWKEAR